MDVTAIATMSLARTEAEAATLRTALQALSSTALPIFASDGGSVQDFYRLVTDVPSLDLTREGSTLVQQVKASLRRSIAAGHRFVLYTEPDKRQFFGAHLADFLAAARSSVQA